MKHLKLFFILLSLSMNVFPATPSDNHQPSNFLQNTYRSLTLIRHGAGKNNVIQGIALDLKNNSLYTLHVTGTPEKAVVNRFNYSGYGLATAIETQLPSGLIGHQGFSVNPIDSSMYSSAGSAIANKGWYITRFTFTPNAQPNDFKIIKVFSDGYSKGTNSMPVFTPNGRFLIVRGKKSGHDVLRIYNLKNKILDSEDISHNFQKEWKIDRSLTKDNFYLQAITADENFIYLLSGDQRLLPKRLFVYDFNGNLISKNENIILGWNIAATSGVEQHWEPEGMSYDKNSKKLLIAFAIGDKGRRKAIVFFVSTDK